ncbi:hypothetical protein PMAYCL1PPCAC_27694, partial [Pristionchus mayeri]
ADYVMLFDESDSLTVGNRTKMVDFLSDFLKLIDLDNSDNRLSLIQFSGFAELTFPLTPKSKIRDILQHMANPNFYMAKGCTNTVDALKTANDKVYATLPNNSTRRKVTILLTDGEPS